MISDYSLPEYPPPLEELRRLWTEDCRKLDPEFELFDPARMGAAILLAAQECGLEDQPDIVIIAWILRNLDEANPRFGIPGWFWWVAASRIILPDVEPHPWALFMWMQAYKARGKRSMISYWGSASSGKSKGFSMIALVSMAIWHGVGHTFVTSPFKVAGLDKIWSNIKSYSDRWADKPTEWMTALGLSVVSNKTDIAFIGEDRKSSNIIFVSLENPASVVGKKSEAGTFDVDGTDSPTSIMDGGEFSLKDLLEKTRRMKYIGMVLLISDEIVHNPVACANLLTAESNLVSNANVLTLVGCNPIPEQINHPAALELSAPTEIDVEKLDEETSFTWRTQRGRLFRLSMHISPNRFGKTAVFPYLINFEQAEAQKIRGDTNYMAQASAWGWGSGAGNGGVLTQAAVQTAEWQGEPIWKTERKRWAFFDLAFGGDDPAGYTCLEAGRCQENGEDRDVIHAVEADRLTINGKWVPTFDEITEFNRLANERGGKAPPLKAGEQQRDGNAHMVFVMLKVAKRLGIPVGMVSFDSSLRMDVTIMARDALGSVIWYYDGQRKLKTEEEVWPMWPPEQMPDGTAKKWSDAHTRPISAIWRFAEHVIVRGHVRGLLKVQKGCFEMLSRRWVRSQKGDHSDLEGKKLFTSAARTHVMKSPLFAETLVMAIMFGVRFAGALPSLGKEKPIAIGRPANFMDHPAFKIRSRSVSRSLWAS